MSNLQHVLRKSVSLAVVLSSSFLVAPRALADGPSHPKADSIRETAGKIAKRATELFPEGTNTITIYSLLVIGASDDLGISKELRMAFAAMEKDGKKLYKIVPQGGDAEVSGEIHRVPKDGTEKVMGFVIELKLHFKHGEIETKVFTATVTDPFEAGAPKVESVSEAAQKIVEMAGKQFPPRTETITVHQFPLIGVTVDFGIENEIKTAFTAMKHDGKQLYTIVPQGGDIEVSGKVTRLPIDSREKFTGFLIKLKLHTKREEEPREIAVILSADSSLVKKNVRAAGRDIAKNAVTLFPSKTETITIHPLIVIGASADLGITNEIKSAFEAMHHDGKPLYTIVPQGGDVELSGEITRVPKDCREKLVGFRIELEIHDKQGRPTQELKVVVSNPFEVASGPDRKNHVVRASPKSPYGVQIMVFDRKTNNYSPRSVEETPGVGLHVQLKKGEVFAVNLINDSKYEAAATVFVDGLGRFVTAKRKEDREAYDLLPPGAKCLIKGYYRDDEDTYTFKVGDNENRGKQLGLPEVRESNCVTVTFAASWKPQDREPPNDLEPNTPGVKARLGITSINLPREEMRTVGRIRAVIKITYGE